MILSLRSAIRAGAFASAIVLVSFGQIPAHGAEGGCTIGNVAGSYGQHGGGIVFSGNAQNAPPGPFSGIGLVQLDGQGNYIIINDTLSFHGAISQNVSGHGTYTVNADCTGSVVEDTGVTANLVFVDNRNEVFSMDTFAGVTDSIIWKRITTNVQ